MAVPAVSVILPFFNAENTLRPAIKSVQRQRFQDWELIAFDDGSEDESLQVAEALAHKDPRIRVASAAHRGIVPALRDACAAAKGRFLARMDADDVAHPDRLRLQMAAMEAEPAAAVCGARVRIVGEAIGLGRRRYETWINRLVRHEDMVRELFVECPLPHPTFFMRRDAYEEAGGYRDQDWPEDYDLIMRFWMAGRRLIKTPEILLDWHDRPMRLSMSSPRYAETAFRALKRHFLFETYLKEDMRFCQWGAGEVGKRWLRDWGPRRPELVVDVHPRKIGRKIHGFPIVPPEALPPPGDTFILVAVGARGARDEIRNYLNTRGYKELEDYLFLS